MNRILKFLVKKKLINERKVTIRVINTKDINLRINISPYNEKYPIEISNKAFFVNSKESKEITIKYYNQRYSYFTIAAFKKGGSIKVLNKTIGIRKKTKEVII